MTLASSDTLVVWNPAAGSAEEASELRNRISATSGVLLLEIAGDESLPMLRHLAPTVRRVIAAGGDGTVNRVLNAVQDRLGQLTFGVLPLGTGNDLCRSLAIPLDPVEAWQVIVNGQTRPIDLARVTTNGEARVFVNVANGGNSNRVSECMTAEMKSRWAAWCYLRGAIDVLSDLQGFRTTVQLDDQPSREYEAWNLIVANGRTAAGGTEVAPRADLEDGLLDVIVVLDPQFIAVLQIAECLSVERASHDGDLGIGAGRLEIERQKDRAVRQIVPLRLAAKSLKNPSLNRNKITPSKTRVNPKFLPRQQNSWVNYRLFAS